MGLCLLQEDVMKDWSELEDNVTWDSDTESDSESSTNRRLSINTEQMRKKMRRSKSLCKYSVD